MEGTIGLSFCTHTLLIDELNKISHKICESTQFKVVKVHTDVEQHVESYLLMFVTIRNQQIWVIPEIHHIGGEGNSFHLGTSFLTY